MTRKVYVSFAKMFRRISPSASPIALEVWRQCVMETADIFATDNPRFDRDKFYLACGLEVLP